MKVAAAFLVVVVAGLSAALSSAQDTCASKPTCAECIGSEFCGWCSPAPTVYQNGTVGSRCQNQTFNNWHCNGVYSTQTCEQGYICNATSGQCMLAPPGQGDTLANCQAQCHKTPPPPTNLSICVIVSPTVQQCQACTDYCTNDTQCPFSYCDNGLCHGSTCTSQEKCTELCTSDTPPLLEGIWRGIMIQHGYGQGEYDMRFQKRTEGPQVTFMRPDGQISTGTLQTDSSVSTDIVLAFTTGPLAGVTLRGGYSPWEPSAVTEQQAFFFAAPNSEKGPASDQDAMVGNGATVYAMSRCSAKSPDCNFSSIFPTTSADDLTFERHNARLLAEAKALKDGPVSDPCQAFATCSQCIAAPTGLCGWCTGEVIYGNSTPGKTQCAGFDQSGKPLNWRCSGVFQKEGCADYGCDWTNPQAPTCSVCNNSQTCTLTQDQCNSTCVQPPMQYKCDNATKTCLPCNITYCTKDSQCPGSYCQIEGPGPWQCHGAVPPACADLPACNASCSHNHTTDLYVCNPFSGQCVQATNSTPGATTKYICEHNCTSIAPLGTWRGVEVNVGFVRGEWDFTFYNDSSLHWRRPDGATFMASLDGLNMTQGLDNTIQITGKIESVSPAQEIYAVFRIDNQGNDMLVDMLFWGQSNSSMPADFESTMVGGNTMHIMNACRGSASNCDFSSSQVFPNADTQLVKVHATPLSKTERFARMLYSTPL